MATVIICVIIAALCLVGVKSALKRSASGCCGSGEGSIKKVKVQDKDLSHYPHCYRIEIDGMTCGNCEKRVANAFNIKEGFYAIANLEKGEVEIHTKNPEDEREMKDSIRSSGYFPGKCEKII